MRLIRFSFYFTAILFWIIWIWMSEPYTWRAGFIFFLVFIFVWSFFKSENERVDLELKKEQLKQLKNQSDIK